MTCFKVTTAVAFAIAALFIYAASVAAEDAMPAVSIKTGNNGLEALEIDGQNILADGSVKVTSVRMADTYRNPHEMKDPYVRDTRTFSDGDLRAAFSRFDTKDNSLQMRYEWGFVHTVYVASENCLDIKISIINSSDKVIEQVDVDLMDIYLPDDTKVALPYLSSWQGIRRGFNVGEVTLQTASYETGRMIMCSPQPNKPLVMQIRKTGEGRFTLGIVSGSDNHVEAEIYEGVWNVRPIKPRRTEEVNVRLLFGPPDIDPYTLAADVCKKFGEEFPMLLNWPDRRPIGAAWIAGHASTEKNPRGWWEHMLAGNDINTPEGKEQFRKAVLATADSIISTVRRGGYQGVIIWDVEGAQNPHPITYIGDPRVLPYLAPEMDEVADAFFKKLTDAGMRVGVTLRPSLPVPLDAEGKVMDTWEGFVKVAQHSWGAKPPHAAEIERNSPVERLSAKITYAQKRWGATIFYVDSNYFYRPRASGTEDGKWSGKQLGAHVFKELLERHPDVLLIPEHQHTEYWAYTAQYSQPPQYGSITLNDIRSVYPEAISLPFLSNAGQHFVENRELLARSVREGDAPLIHGWYYGGGIELLREVYVETLKDAIQVYIDADAGITVQGEKLAQRSQLPNAIARLAYGKPLEERRVFVKYHSEVTPARLKQILNLITDGHGIISWSQVADTP